MGNSDSKGSSFRWVDRYQLIDIDNNDKILKLMSRVGESQYIGKEITCIGSKQIRMTQEMIDKKVLAPSPFVVKLVKVGEKVEEFSCTENKTFCLIFEKPFKTLKEDTIYRKIENRPFTESEIQCILSSCLYGLHYLNSLGQFHGKISYNNVFINQDQTLIINDPWLTENQSELNKKINANVYPSPQKILFQRGYIQHIDIFQSDLFSLGVMLLDIYFLQHMDVLYEKGYRRLIESKVIEMVNKFKSEQLRYKMRILLSHQIGKRAQIFKFYQFDKSKAQKFISLQKQSFKKQYIKDSLVTSQVKTVKISKKDNNFRQLQPSSLRFEHSVISSDTIRQQKMLNRAFIQYNCIEPRYYKENTPQKCYNRLPVKGEPNFKQFTFNKNEVKQVDKNSISSIDRIDSQRSKDNIGLQLFDSYKRYAENCVQYRNYHNLPKFTQMRAYPKNPKPL